MKKLPFVIMNRKAYEKRMDELDRVSGKCASLEEKLIDANMTIEDMKCGNLVCGDHCESCKNSFIRKDVSVYGTYSRIHCKLKAANTCVSYQPIDPA
jgi:hypothetical protein